MEVAYLFVYGTLRSDSGHPMHRVLTADASLVGPATVGGDLHKVGDNLALVPNAGSAAVKGELYEIRRDALERLLHTLDEYEGIGDPSHDEYRRTVVTATLDDGRDVRTWAYVLNP
jgi:gamma-glutamylcyclotransferase (GGCT)/AIG2-like uncharacterized protein YtfP